MRTFHDAVVEAFRVCTGRISLKITNVSNYGPEGAVQETGELRISSVSSFLEDGVPVEEPTIDFDDGQILELEMDGKNVTMLVEWESYGGGETTVCSYRISGRSVSWVVSSDATAGPSQMPSTS